jgi:outer membrane protein OmpA-like peptidoglycan-associated protein
MKTVRQFALVVAFAGMLAATGCKSLNRTQKGAGIGVIGGGAVGAVVGRALGNTAMGAVVGAAVGGVAGGVIGRRMDKQAEEMQKVLGDAEVKRVEEGIVIEFKDKVLFGYDKSDLGATAQANLNKLANVLNKYPDTNISILGHTDDKGTDEYNQGLSERRATSAAGYLRSQGIASSRISTRGLGESDPKVANDSEANRAENRRVEFVITANQKMIEDAKREAGQ